MYNVKWLNEISRQIYYADHDQLQFIIKEIESIKLEQVEEWEKLYIFKALSTAYGYIHSEPSLDSLKAIEYLGKILSLPERKYQDEVQAKIRKSNILRLMGQSEEARDILDEIEDEARYNPENRMEERWVRALLNIDKLTQYIQHTIETQEAYNNIPHTRINIYLIDKYLCTCVWRGFQTEREAVELRSKGYSKEADKLIDEAENIFMTALRECKEGKIRREADLLVHLAVLSLIKKDAEASQRYIDLAIQTGASYVEGFKKQIVQPGIQIIKNVRPQDFKSFDFQRYAEEGKAWSFIYEFLLDKFGKIK